FTNYAVSTNDLERLGEVPKTWLGKSGQGRLDYETMLELLAERAHAQPALVRRLNPQIVWSNVVAGTVVRLPWCDYPLYKTKAARVRIRLGARTLAAFDANTNLLVQFPCSIA